MAFHKPFQVLTQFTSHASAESGVEERKTLADYIRVPGVYAAGRLDYDSEGLLLLTDDGAFQHELTDPKFEHPRAYWAQVEGAVTEEALTKLRAGVEIRDYKTKPAQARHLPQEPDLAPRVPPIRFRKEIPTDWIELTLTEGRNRQVRRMTAAVGLPTLRLVRVAIGPVTLEGLAPGDWRDLTAKELQILRQGRRRS